MSDLLPGLIATSDEVLKSFDLRWYPEPAAQGMTLALSCRLA